MISILLASYNGEKHIADQITSILNQTCQDFRIYVCDDCSSDNTFSVLQKFQELYPEQIFVSRSTVNTGSAKHNFIRMMIEHKDDYVMLCDQDDIWLPNKIELTMAKMQNLESIHGKDTPILVHTDLIVVDEKLAVISPSFKAAMNANYDRTQLRQLLIQNTLTGCTAMYNRSLSELIQTEPLFMVMHDWWLALVAGAFGMVDHLDDKTILYRQHSGNTIGAKDVRTISYKFNRLFHGEEIRQAITNTYPQAQSMLDEFKGRLTPDQTQLLKAYCDIPKKHKLQRCIAICKLRTFKHGIARKIANFIFI